MARRKKPKLEIGRWYRVDWDDALASNPGWISLEEARKNGVAAIVTVGKVVHVDERQVILAQSAGGDDNDHEVMNTQAIPTGWITAVAELP